MAPADLIWGDDNVPVSSQHDDVYFSRHNPQEETQFVFLEQNHLPKRWTDLEKDTTFTIAESGFGTGLNFLCAWQLWEKTAPESATLYFISAEKFPMRPEDIERSLSDWPELAEYKQQLLDAYPKVLSSGVHHLHFKHRKVNLVLLFDDVKSGFNQLLMSPSPHWQTSRVEIDAWFLDGFAPAKNSDMWQQSFFDLMATLASNQGTFATFTAAGFVRRGLQQAGFEVEKVPGFGSKREMLRGGRTSPASCKSALDAKELGSDEPRRLPRMGETPWYVDTHSVSGEKSAVVVGGGLSGCHTARAMAEKGWRVTLLERHSALAMEASGNDQGIVYAKLSHRGETQSDFNLAALLFAQRTYKSQWQSAEIGSACGVAQLDFPRENAEALITSLGDQQLIQYLDAEELSIRAGIPIHQSGLFFPDSGWIAPTKLCAELIGHPNIDVAYNTDVESLSYNDANQHWTINTTSIQFKTTTVVLCSANDTIRLSQTSHLPIKPVRGQISQFTKTPSTAKLNCVLCSDGYIAPAHLDQQCLGATFKVRDLDSEVRSEEHLENIQRLHAQFPELELDQLDVDSLSGRASFRCTTPDYLPIVGPAPIFDSYLDTFSALRKNARLLIDQCGPNYSGLYLNIGHGSRGLAYTPISAEIVASLINKDPMPLSPALEQALHPARFIIRNLGRNKI